MTGHYRINLQVRLERRRENAFKSFEKETCAECRFCCSFRRCSLWETPLFPKEVMDSLERRAVRLCLKADGFGKRIRSDGFNRKYRTQDSEEEAACEFLDAHKGCTLNNEEKPFDCKIWPLRIMKENEKYVIALTPTCPAINQVPLEQMKALVEDGLGKNIYEYAKEHPYIVKEYREGFPVLMTF